MLKKIENFKSRAYSLRNKVLWHIAIPYSHGSSESIHLDLGCGSNPRNPFGAGKLIAGDVIQLEFNLVNIDFVSVDLTQPLPFENETLDSVSAYDVLEHIPRWNKNGSIIEYPFINLMSEIFRILKPGGKFIAVTPAFPSAAAFQDPTHVNIVSKETLLYFTGEEPWANKLGYGFNGKFKVLLQTWKRTESVYREAKMQEKYPNWLKVVYYSARLWMIRKPSHLIWVLEK